MGGGSGGPFVTGAVNVFYPYLRSSQTKFTAQNRYVSSWQKRVGCMCGGPTTDQFPSGMSAVPFVWHYYLEDFQMQFLGGFIGTSQDPETKMVRPVLGWGVADRIK